MRYLIFFVLISTVSCTEINTNQKHIGEWIGYDKGKKVSLLLNDDNTTALVHGNQVIGGDNQDCDGIKCSLRYEIDYSKDPIQLDIFMYNESESIRSDFSMRCIIRFLSTTKMELRANFDPSTDRFTYFDYNDIENTCVFEKVVKSNRNFLLN